MTDGEGREEVQGVVSAQGVNEASWICTQYITEHGSTRRGKGQSTHLST
jgi:hypothetical protein